MTIFSAALLLFLVMDPFGNVPLFLSVLQPIAPERRRKVIVRELLLALAFLILFLFAGRYLLDAIGISESVLTVAGGLVLFLIALHMVFPPVGGAFAVDMEAAENDPVLVPLAVPFLAGPSALASVLFVMSSDPSRWPEWLAAVLLAWAATGLILFYSTALAELLKRRGLVAMERLMGMVLIAIATKMVLTGIGAFFHL
ncbi:MAG: MarC family protein [Chthoniobacter sp.]|uniref:MarC family protein n=1 Tax=Chthoniobacter sp. TaxID=2510640 RepID=UPI0032A82FBD